MRGITTPAIEAKSLELMGYPIKTIELRLMPYVHYVMTNAQKLDPNKMNQDDRDILTVWRERGWIEGGAGGMTITREFYDILCEIIWLGYVDI